MLATANTEVEVANLALDLLGSKIEIASLADASEEAKACARHFAVARNAALGLADWPFAHAAEKLAIATTTEEVPVDGDVERTPRTPVYDVVRSDPESSGYEVVVSGRCVGDHEVVFTALAVAAPTGSTFTITIDGDPLPDENDPGRPLAVRTDGFGTLDEFDDYTMGFGWLWSLLATGFDRDALMSLDGLRWTISPVPGGPNPPTTFGGETYTFRSQPTSWLPKPGAATAEAELVEWDHAYREPSEAVALWGIYPNARLVSVHDRIPFSPVRFGDTTVLGCDMEPTDEGPVLQYTRLVSSPADWPPYFADLVVAELATRLAMPMRVDARMRGVAMDAAARARYSALVAARIQRQEDQAPVPDVILARR